MAVYILDCVVPVFVDAFSKMDLTEAQYQRILNISQQLSVLFTRRNCLTEYILTYLHYSAEESEGLEQLHQHDRERSEDLVQELSRGDDLDEHAYERARSRCLKFRAFVGMLTTFTCSFYSQGGQEQECLSHSVRSGDTGNTEINPGNGNDKLRLLPDRPMVSPDFGRPSPLTSLRDIRAADTSTADKIMLVRESMSYVHRAASEALARVKTNSDPSRMDREGGAATADVGKRSQQAPSSDPDIVGWTRLEQVFVTNSGLSNPYNNPMNPTSPLHAFLPRPDADPLTLLLLGAC